MTYAHEPMDTACFQWFRYMRDICEIFLIRSWYVWYRWWLLYPQSKPMFCFNLVARAWDYPRIYTGMIIGWLGWITVQPTLLPIQIRSSVPSDISIWRVTPMIIWNAKFHGPLDPFIHINLFLLIFWCPFVPANKKSDPFVGTAGSFFGFQDVMRQAVWVGNLMSFGPSGFLGHMEIFFGQAPCAPWNWQPADGSKKMNRLDEATCWHILKRKNGPWSKISCVCVCIVVCVWVELFNHI